MFKYIDCIDASTDYCPCTLADVGECLICSQLKGECFCDCINYPGTCIYQEYIWNNEKSKRTRQFRVYNILSKKYLRDDIVLFEIKVNNGLARELNNWGAFVFLRKPGDSENCSVPISIMDCDLYNNIITVAIKIVGIKTKMLSKCTDTLMVKGPYWNGIQGQKFLKTLINDTCLIIGRGCALPPTILAAKKLVKKNNKVFAILEKGRSNQSYFKPYFDNLNIVSENTKIMDRSNLLNEEGKALIIKYLKDYNIKTVLSAGDDIFHRKIINFIYEFDNKINFATVNNSTMCCGEGQCGSCIIENTKGNIIRSCKQQYNPIEVFLDKGVSE